MQKVKPSPLFTGNEEVPLVFEKNRLEKKVFVPHLFLHETTGRIQYRPPYMDNYQTPSSADEGSTASNYDGKFIIVR